MIIAKIQNQHALKFLVYDKLTENFIILKKDRDSGWISNAWKVKKFFINDLGFKKILEKESESGEYKKIYIKRFKKLSIKKIKFLIDEGGLLPWVSWFCEKY